MRHLRFLGEVYQFQIDRGRVFLHEHPAGASSWKLGMMEKLRVQPGVEICTADQCMYGLTTQDDKGSTARARKTTKFMTNSHEIAKQLGRRRDNSHKHYPLVSGRAAAAAVYPQELCRAVCAGLKEEVKLRRQGVRMLMSLKAVTKIETVSYTHLTLPTNREV